MAAVPVPPLGSEVVLHIGSFEIRNTLLMAWAAMAVLTLIGLRLKATRYKLVPGRFQMGMELVVGGLYDFFNGIFANNDKTTRKFFPLLATLFIFIMLSNWMGLLPGVGTIMIPGIHNGHEMMLPLLRSMNSDVNMTLVFAVVSVIFTQLVGFVTLGILPHMGKYIVMPWKKPYGIGTFVGLLELIGEVAKVISFAFRLFGNIFAGEVLLVVISSLVPYLVPVPFMGLELFVGVIQALVFAMLTAVFISMAMTAHGDHDHA